MSFQNRYLLLFVSFSLATCFIVTAFSLLPRILSLHTPLFISTIAICASISMSVIFVTVIKIYHNSITLDLESQQSQSQNLSSNPTDESEQTNAGACRLQILRSTSLPTYENAVSEQSCKTDETPPPTFHEIHNPQWPQWI